MWEKAKSLKLHVFHVAVEINQITHFPYVQKSIKSHIFHECN